MGEEGERTDWERALNVIQGENPYCNHSHAAYFFDHTNMAILFFCVGSWPDGPSKR